jgi:ATP-dependent DNA helicase HFM1/MER3
MPIAHGIKQISPRQALPDKVHALFPYDLFNAVQSKCFDSAYGSKDNMVISAPTSSGKTAILELAICRELVERSDGNYKIVYQAPTKALCAERTRDWQKRMSYLNVQVAELTGDTSAAEMRRVGSATIIVTTPEKWDSITRRWEDHRKLVQLVVLFLIDEVHMLKDYRGATLEAVISRMKTIGSSVRFVALSATVPNSEDIATWLGRNHVNPQLPALRETFGEDFRPVKLQKFVYGYDHKGNDFIFDHFLDQKLPLLISKHSGKKPILVFCFTRKSCQETAKKLAENWAAGTVGDKSWPAPKARVPVVSADLQDLVRFGVAFHHGGLGLEDRASVEKHFLSGDISVICCTSTLAVGVNLPCHTVVLKGTAKCQDGGTCEYSDLEVMQMLGRAGRPQFDRSAVAIILTQSDKQAKYEKMVSGEEILESTLHLSLIEHLNSEIGLRTIHDLSSAKRWLNGTFLSVRLKRNPGYYRQIAAAVSLQDADQHLEDICERDIQLLQENGFVFHGGSFTSTEYGKAMAKYMVQFEGMQKLLQIPRAVTMEQLVSVLPCVLVEHLTDSHS